MFSNETVNLSRGWTVFIFTQNWIYRTNVQLTQEISQESISFSGFVAYVSWWQQSLWSQKALAPNPISTFTNI